MWQLKKVIKKITNTINAKINKQNAQQGPKKILSYHTINAYKHSCKKIAKNRCWLNIINVLFEHILIVFSVDIVDSICFKLMVLFYL